MSFSEELSERIQSHSKFHTMKHALSIASARQLISEKISTSSPDPGEDSLGDLLYCAKIFAQSSKDAHKKIAQEIAINAAVICDEDDVRSVAVDILTSVGNFPTATYLRNKFQTKFRRVSSALGHNVSRELNSVNVANERLALTDFQYDVWDDFHSEHRAKSISAPTSAGKSFLIIEKICQEIDKSHSYNCVYLAPTRALVAEVSRKFQLRLSNQKDLRVTTIPTMFDDTVLRQVFILTQERFAALLSATDMVFDHIIVDEAQGISSGARGIILQDTINQALMRSESTKLSLLAPGATGFDRYARAVGLAEIKAASTSVSPVLQNRIQVETRPGQNGLELSLLGDNGKNLIGQLKSERGFDNPKTRLASVALELGKVGGSLVYASGPVEAEKIAQTIYFGSNASKNEELQELSEFIKSHIHKDYSLAEFVLRGVAFHYGKMPALLRQGIEDAFKSGSIKFLVCTTTLFEGVNLPARNVFISSPTRGNGKSLDSAALWNFAGRAGRMKSDIVGNVFLIDYSRWKTQSMDSFVPYEIRPILFETIKNEPYRVVDAVYGNMPKVRNDDPNADVIRAAAGFLIAKAKQTHVAGYLEAALPELSKQVLEDISDAADVSNDHIRLPADLLKTNWNVDPYGIQRLSDSIDKIFQEGHVQQAIPVSPNEQDASKSYGDIFSDIERNIEQRSSRFPQVVAGYAVEWMRGASYPRLISKKLKSARLEYSRKLAQYQLDKANGEVGRRRPPKPVDVNDVVRNVFEMIEDTVRFRYVQMGKVYIDLLRAKLLADGGEYDSIFDFSLALELGVSSITAMSLLEIGLSRISATTLSGLIPDTHMDVKSARSWLLDFDLSGLKLSSVIIKDIENVKKLIEADS